MLQALAQASISSPPACTKHLYYQTLIVTIPFSASDHSSPNHIISTCSVSSLTFSVHESSTSPHHRIRPPQSQNGWRLVHGQKMRTAHQHSGRQLRRIRRKFKKKKKKEKKLKTIFFSFFRQPADGDFHCHGCCSNRRHSWRQPCRTGVDEARASSF